MSETDRDQAQRERALQAWGLEIHDEATPATLAAVRKVLRTKRSEREALSRSLPGVVRRGARVDLAPLAEQLAGLGVRSNVVRLERE